MLPRSPIRPCLILTATATRRSDDADGDDHNENATTAVTKTCEQQLLLLEGLSMWAVCIGAPLCRSESVCMAVCLLALRASARACLRACVPPCLRACVPVIVRLCLA